MCKSLTGEVTLKPLRANEDGANEQKRVSVDRIGEEIINAFFDGDED